MFSALHMDPIEGFQLLDATDLRLEESAASPAYDYWTGVRFFCSIKCQTNLYGEIAI